MRRVQVCLLLLVIAVTLFGCQSPKVATISGWVEKGRSTDGAGIDLSPNLPDIQENNLEYRLICLGSCGQWMSRSVDKRALTDPSKRITVFMTSDRDTYALLKVKRKANVIYDNNSRLHMKISAIVAPRQYILSPKGTIMVAETGNPKNDSEAGFDAL